MTSRTVDFRWNAPSSCPGLDVYTFRVVDDPTKIDSGPWLIDYGIDAPDSETNETFDSDGDYWWAVWPCRGCKAGDPDYGERSEVRYFRIDTSSPPPPPPPSGTWNATYFNDTNLASRCGEGDILGTYAFGDWGQDAPASACPADDWSARFTRRVHFESGTYDFGLGSDDWARIKIGSETVVNSWDGASQHYESRTLSEGDYDVAIEFADTLGEAKLAAWWWGPGFDVPRQSRDTSQWYAEYWGNQDLWWDSIVRVNEGAGPLTHSWGDGGPGYGLPNDRFSSRFERRVYLDCGNYRFHVSADDGVRFWVDEQLRLDNWVDGVHSDDVYVDLSSGYHDLKVEHYENGGGAGIGLEWFLESACAPDPPDLRSPGDGSTFEEGESITLNWSDAGDEYYGEIWGGPGETLTFGWQSGTSYNLGSQWAGYTYAWHVKARNDTVESGWSDTRTFTVKPAAPSNLSAQTASCSQINLYWDDNSGNEEGYKIYRNGSYVDQVGANTTNYRDTSLTENTSYSYYVKAFQGSIESDNSNTVSATTPPCTPPEPDLRPYAPPGYPYPVVPSSISGTQEVNTLYAGHATYFDWHFTNSGDATASGDFYVELWVDDTRYVRYPYSDYLAGWTGGFDDWAETISAPGWHTVRLVTDPDDAITESDETNNTWQRDFYWTAIAPYADDMESGASEWTATGLWHRVDESSSSHRSHSWSHSWWYGQDATYDYDTGAANSGDLTSPPIQIPDSGYYLRFWYWYETETQGTDRDQRWVQVSVDGGPFANVLQLRDDPMGRWLQSQAIDLSAYAGHTVRLRFRFDTLSSDQNSYRGWYIDDLEISNASPPACGDSHEPNDSSANATPIVYGQSLDGDVCPGGDYDFYQFTGDQGDKIVVDIDAMSEGSQLDPYVYLIAEDGSTVLAQHDDEIIGEVRDPVLGHQLPYTGTYYVKLKAWDHPSAGSPDHSYTIRLSTDDASPSSVEMTYPPNDSWLDPDAVTATVSAVDNESGINRVEFLWHDADWGNSDWVWLGADYDGRDGWSWPFDTGSEPEQHGGAFYVWAFDWVGNWTGAASWGLGIDRTAPTVSPGTSSLYGDAPFRDFWVFWVGVDNLSGAVSYDIQVRDGADGSWSDLALGTTDTYTRYVGTDGHTYYFRVRARDVANNEGVYSTEEVSHTVDICPASADGYELDDTPSDAGWLTPDGALQVHNFHRERDEDWVRFYAAAGISYTLSTTSTSTHADTVLYLYDGDGRTMIDRNDDHTGMWPLSRLEWRPSTSGYYFARVRHFDPWAYGCTTEYGLSLAASELTPFPRVYLPLAMSGR